MIGWHATFYLRTLVMRQFWFLEAPGVLFYDYFFMDGTMEFRMQTGAELRRQTWPG